MLVNLKEITEIAEKGGFAIGAFNAPNLETLIAVIDSAEELSCPVILQHAQVHDALIPMETIAPIMLDFGKKASVPVCVHLDHGTDYEECMKALRLGFTSIMFDASGAPYEENVLKTGEVVKIALSMGVSVEAELGHIFSFDAGSGEGGKSINDYQSASDSYTDPDTAKDFVDRTAVDALAVVFGTAHGIYKIKPVLDLDRIALIKEKVNIPLVMHGGSGVSDEEFRAAIKNGIRKINYYTYMAVDGANAVIRLLDKKTDKDNMQYHAIAITAQAAMKEHVLKAMKVFSMK